MAGILLNGTNYSDSGGTTVVANPSGTATDDLTSIQIESTIYDLPNGGTTVVANPSGSTTDELEKVQIGSTIYDISGSTNSDGLIPKMTSNTTPSGTVSANVDATNAWKAFDGDETTYWDVSNTDNYSEIYYSFESPVKVSRIVIKYGQINNIGRTFIYIYGRNGSEDSWHSIDTTIGRWTYLPDSSSIYDISYIYSSNFVETYEYSQFKIESMFARSSHSEMYYIHSIQFYSESQYCSLNDITNVDVSSVNNNDVILYNADEYRWKSTATVDTINELSTDYTLPSTDAVINYTKDKTNQLYDNIYKNIYTGSRNYITNLKLDYCASGITCLPCDEGYVINGQLSSNGGVKFTFNAPVGNYIFSIGYNITYYPSQSDPDDYATVHFTNMSPLSWLDGDDYTSGSNGSESEMEVLSYTGENSFTIYLRPRTYTNLIIKPMLRLENDSNSNYELPIKTNKELQEQNEIYSTEKKPVGHWIDGSVLYSKTIYVNNISLTQGQSDFTWVEPLVSAKDDVNEIWIHDGYYINGGSSRYTLSNSYIEFSVTSSNGGAIYYEALENISSGEFYITVYYTINT